MRLSLIGASAALAAGLALSACSGGTGSSAMPSGGTGSSAAMPSSGAQISKIVQGQKVTIRTMPGVKVLATLYCGPQYSFCFYVIPGDYGPYVETSGGTAPLYNVGSIVKAKKNKVAKKFTDYFYPDPGDPTYQYIDYTGKTPKKPGKVKWTDIYCISFTASGCANGTGSILYLGIALYP